MNPDFVDLLRAFVAADVRFLIVGAYALALHGRPRDRRPRCVDRSVRRQRAQSEVDFIGREAFIHNKCATGRPTDLGDIEGM
jgi:hypothetical protein